MIRALDHNDEQITWAEQTEIELHNFLKEFDQTVWPVMKAYGYTKDGALNYWQAAHVNQRLWQVIDLLREERA